MYVYEQGDDTPYSMPWGLGKLYPRYIRNKDVLVCPSFRVLAPEVVEEMHQISKTYRGRPWTSYWEVCPEGWDEIARENPEVLGFTEVYVKRGNQTPIVWCDAHRFGCPNSNYSISHSPKGKDFILRGGCGGTGKIKFEQDMIVVEMGAPPNPDAPLVVLRWGGSVNLVHVFSEDALMLWY